MKRLKKLWVGGSSIGQQRTHLNAIAHAVLAYYLPKFGDIRGSNEYDPTATTIVDFQRFYSYKVQYAKIATPGTVTTEFVAGATLLNKSLVNMASELGQQFDTYANRGLFPQAIMFSHLNTNLVYADQNLSKNKITVQISGRFRFNNTTPAGDGGVGESTSINDVDANPLSGKIYTFRNQSPIFQSTFKDAALPFVQDGIQNLNTVYPGFEVYGDTTVAAEGKGAAAFRDIDAPPLNPKAIWKNVKTTGNVAFPPGGFKTFNTSYLRQGTIMTYIRDISQAVSNDNGGVLSISAPVYPPAGDSFMMCLRPMIKTSGN